MTLGELSNFPPTEPTNSQAAKRYADIAWATTEATQHRAVGYSVRNPSGA